MITDALAGNFDVLVVHKLDRFSRNLRITLEYFDKLLKAGVAFVSINEQMDYTTPSVKVHLALLGAFAQYYSDNLSQETKKGWHERRAQGLYCGLLPFGAMKGEDGVPVPNPDTHLGLVMAFELAAQGKSDREVAVALNEKEYRAAGNQGNRPFSRGTTRGMLTNRFYLGYLPDGNGGWVKGKHEAFTSTESHVSTLGKLAKFLSSVAKAWKEANQEQRNKLARTLFQEIWIKDKQVVALKPQPEFEPFFRLNYEGFVKKS
ncbi:MAG: recombinase family protein, partial [Dehalococcoidia bacterium]|nr:recombinase family protein [Dehalococcoidia bacterium]